jgi:transposase
LTGVGNLVSLDEKGEGQMPKKYIVRLSEEERIKLEKLISSGSGAARKLNHARILLKADADGENWIDEQIRVALNTSLSTIERVREAFVEEGVEAALNRKRPRKTRERKLDGVQEAHLIALACAPSPEGRKRWTLRLLADKMVELEYIDTLSYETVRQILKKTNLSLG